MAVSPGLKVLHSYQSVYDAESATLIQAAPARPSRTQVASVLSLVFVALCLGMFFWTSSPPPSASMYTRAVPSMATLPTTQGRATKRVPPSQAQAPAFVRLQPTMGTSMHTMKMQAGLRKPMDSTRGPLPTKALESEAAPVKEEAEGQLKVYLTPNEAIQTTLLSQVVKDDERLIFIEGVQTSSTAADSGMVPGQVVRAITHPIEKGQMWTLDSNSRLKFVRDAFLTMRMRGLDEIVIVVDKEPYIAPEDVPQIEEEEEDEEEEEQPPPPPPRAQEITDRKDLYSENWEGDIYVGKGRWNELTVGLALLVGVPLIGLAFAAATYGKLWGLSQY